jgi:hypothetical protein
MRPYSMAVAPFLSLNTLLRIFIIHPFDVDVRCSSIPAAAALPLRPRPCREVKPRQASFASALEAGLSSNGTNRIQLLPALAQ